MKNSGDFEFDDLQGLVRFGYGKLTETCFLLLNIKDVTAAKAWLSTAPVTNAVNADKPYATALQIAFTSQGLQALGIEKPIIESFSDEFISGLSGFGLSEDGLSRDASRSRRLGDVDANAPENWQWGGKLGQIPHVLMLLYADPKFAKIEDWRKTIEGKNFAKAFAVLAELPTQDIGAFEPFGFADGISQPDIDWQRQQNNDSQNRFTYSNLLAVGEVVLGYPNEYQQYTNRPLLDPSQDKLAATFLAEAEDQFKLKDFGRNGTYLVLRQLDQDVPGFWRFVDKAAGGTQQRRDQFAAAMVGRNRDGSPLLAKTDETIPGIPTDDNLNHFTYSADPLGQQCPFGAHIRRVNPRTGDMPGKVTSWWLWLLKILGYGLSRPEEDLIASARFHRLLRRGRSYGPKLSPEDAVKPNAPKAERGLHFICLVANIQRQFEFVQNAWVVSSKFAGLQQESDPLLGHRKPLNNGEVTDEFHQPQVSGPMHKTCGLPQFITVRGGAYFFMPGLRALKYIAAVQSPAKSAKGSDKTT